LDVFSLRLRLAGPVLAAFAQSRAESYAPDLLPQWPFRPPLVGPVCRQRQAGLLRPACCFFREGNIRVAIRKTTAALAMADPPDCQSLLSLKALFRSALRINAARNRKAPS
jgi:hypothetical protein